MQGAEHRLIVISFYQLPSECNLWGFQTSMLEDYAIFYANWKKFLISSIILLKAMDVGTLNVPVFCEV